MTMSRLCFDSLDGLSVGDALGAQFFVPGVSAEDFAAGHIPAGPWPWTDDTEMACSIAEQLQTHGRIDQDRLAMAFAERFEPYRGYGGGAVVVLRQIREGAAWRDVARSVFQGQGSMGNGAAMRVAPLGAFHADDSRTAALEAMRSAEVTHAHAEAVLGAVAVAVAAAEAGWGRTVGVRPEAGELLNSALDHLVESRVRRGIERARTLLGGSVAEAAYELGNGSQVLAQDTVPFTLWVAATHLHDYPAAIAACVEAGGDVDTTSAIVGGIVAAYTGSGVNGIPRTWLRRREALPDWLPQAVVPGQEGRGSDDPLLAESAGE
ncbi:ADP-ribosylglycohydrolase [Micromonospora pisi]|uniref:ADP-ribosylglycohydrolase n=1 Tax=Micromonospora pisi TaxID=589240 RepID=A0A495JD20_9ACTN|nr:ADP-ribosylglycohydrolase family protein [Micromonospora pisi]RKR85959.1 ADP-ribosylglycohydrolase [Micromonospora pisi]